MASNGVPGKDGIALKKRKATSASARVKLDEHEDQELPLPLSAVKKSKRGVASRHESEFVSVEVGLRELQKRMASSSTTPEKAQKMRASKQEAETPSAKETAKKATSGRAKIPIAAVEIADEEPKPKPSAASAKRRSKAAAAATPVATGAASPPEPETPVKASRRSATPTKRTATVVAAESVPKRAVKPKTAPAKSVLDTLAQARAAAMQQQQERIQQRIQGLTGAASAQAAQRAPRRSPVLRSQETPRPKAPVVEALLPPSVAVPDQHQASPEPVAGSTSQMASRSPLRVSDEEEKATAAAPPTVLPSPRVIVAEATVVVGNPLGARLESAPLETSTQETTSSQGFIEEEGFDDDLAFLQALEEVESKLQTPTKPPRPYMTPSTQEASLAAASPQGTNGGNDPVLPSALSPQQTQIVNGSATVAQEQSPPLRPSLPISTASVQPSSPPASASMSTPPQVAVPEPVERVVTPPPQESPAREVPAQVSLQVTTALAGAPSTTTVASPPPAPFAPTPAPVASPAVLAPPAIPPEILAEYERLKRENEALRRSNELLQAGQSTISTPASPVIVPVVASVVGAHTGADLPLNNRHTTSPLKHKGTNTTVDEVAAEESKQNEVATALSPVPTVTGDAPAIAANSVLIDETNANVGDVDADIAEEPLDVEVGGDVDADSGFAEDEEGDEGDNGEEELDLSQPVEVHQSTIDRGNYAQYRASARSNEDDGDQEEDSTAYAHVRPAISKPFRSSRAVSHQSQKRQEVRRHVSAPTVQSTSRAVQAPTRQITRPVVLDDSETESDQEQLHRRRVIVLPDSSSSSSEESDDEEEGGSKSGSSVLDAALRAATGKPPRNVTAKTAKESSSEERARALETVKDEPIDPTSAIEPPTKRTTKKRRATTPSATDKSTLLWPSLDDFYDFVLDLTPRRVLLSDPLHLQLLRAYEKARARLPTQYQGLAQYCDVQLEAILEELLSSVRNAEEMSLHNSSRSRLWLTSISPCSNTSRHTTTVMNAALASSSTSSSLNPNVIFMESGFSGTSAPGKNDYIVTFQDNRAGVNQKSALSDFVSGDLLAMRSPAWRDHDVYAFGIVLCSSVVAVGGSASSGNGISSANQDQLCVLLRAPAPTEDDPDAANRFASIVEMCLVNQRSTQWCWSLDQVHNLTTSAREFQAIKSVRLFKPETKEMILSGIIPEIVKTVQTQIVEPRKKLSSGLYEELEGKYNSSQLQAILGSISDESAISIIQGPPGTGKTKTILGVLSALLDGAALSSTRQAHVKSRIRIGASLQENSSKSSSKNTGNDQKSVAQSTIRVLVAAPSNAAVDELIVRLISEGVYDARQGKAYRPRIVRVGRPESLQQSRPSLSDRNQDPKSQDILQKKKWRKYASEVEEILLENLVNKHKSSFPTAKQARQSIIQNAQIVFCTLSGAGSVAMCELQSQHFDALVIDEAAQAVEASLLIPFKFQPSRIVLVGDHRQLPATVISKRLIDLGYDRSLFQRLVENGSRVFMLLQQYRMHPEISWFPSTYFYNGKLVEAPQMKEWTARKYHSETFFRPFVFYDVLSGKQSQVTGSKSLRNVNEIECILELLTRLVVKQFPELEWRRKIGIIAPYKQQIYELRNELQRWEKKHDKKLDIEVNTVDGFQGREKEVIIYSCVRTSRTGQNRSNRQNNGQSIEAFWADERRMNVAITRAKSSLWIIGNSTLLQQSAAWRALITHAKDSRRYMLEEDLSGTKRHDSDADRRSRDRSQSQAKSSNRSRSDSRSRDSRDRSMAQERRRSRSRSRSRSRDDRDRRR